MGITTVLRYDFDLRDDVTPYEAALLSYFFVWWHAAEPWPDVTKWSEWDGISRHFKEVKGDD